jgi:hypothetical protein
MRACGLILCILLVTLSGCIVTYRDFPIVDPLPGVYEPTAPPRGHHTVKHVARLADGSTYTVTESDVVLPLSLVKALQEALKSYGGCSSGSPGDHKSKRAETEVVVSALEKQIPGEWREFWRNSAYGSLLIFPFIEYIGWELSYSVYDRNALTKTYTYEISVKAFYWLLLLPFSWINFFTYTLEDAVRSTTAQFVIDAQRDGYLGTKN